MKSKKMLKFAGIILAAGILLQTGIMAYTGLLVNTTDDVDTSNVIVSTEVQNLIKNQDTENYDKNLNNYKRMIVLLNVHEDFKNQLESMVKEGNRLTDIMIAYTFINDCYGKIEQVKELTNEKESGGNWADIFKKYITEKQAFVPRSFDFEYLESLMKEAGITNDDIMIADRVSQNAGIEFNEIIDEKIAGKSWKDINANYGIVNGQEAMPRVSVTSEQLKKHTSDGILSEEQVTETLVTAFKLGITEQLAVEKAKAGYKTEDFFAEVLEEMYRS